MYTKSNKSSALEIWFVYVIVLNTHTRTHTHTHMWWMTSRSILHDTLCSLQFVIVLEINWCLYQTVRIPSEAIMLTPKEKKKHFKIGKTTLDIFARTGEKEDEKYKERSAKKAIRNRSDWCWFLRVARVRKTREKEAKVNDKNTLMNAKRHCPMSLESLSLFWFSLQRLYAYALAFWTLQSISHILHILQCSVHSTICIFFSEKEVLAFIYRRW